MRITKSIAEDVAIKLTAKKREELSSIENEIRETLESFILKRLDKKIIDFHKSFPNYTNTSKSYRVSGNGFNFQYLETKNSLPCNNNNSFEPSPEEAKTLLSLINKKKDLRDKLENLQKKIEVLLYNLRTYSKVILEFPEAEPFLPNTISDKLTINVSDIRKQLK